MHDFDRLMADSSRAVPTNRSASRETSATSRPDDAPHVALLLPDGVGVRNFLLGSFREEARGRLALSVIHTLPAESRAVYEGDPDETVAWHELISAPDSTALATFRSLVHYAHMYSVKTFSMRCNLGLPVRASLKRRVSVHATRAAGRLMAGLSAVRWLDSRLAAIVARRPETAAYRRLFETMRPDVLLSSNQRPASVLPAVLAARALGIPTATCIFSWDNLTSKGRIAAPFDHYLVWSDLMKRELRTYYPEIAEDRMHVVGALQFDPHADPRQLQTREAFFARIGADPSRPLVCYSSGDPGTTPEDQHHVELLLRLIRDGRIAGRPQVALRPTPAADGRRFEGVRQRYPELIYLPPDWVRSTAQDWSQVLPLPTDVALLANLAHHADVNVNVASTMTMDFAMHNRPVVNVAFDIADPPPFARPLWDYYYQFEHYQTVVKAGAALFARSADELAAHVNTYLANPRLHEANRRNLIDEELGVPIGQGSRHLVDVIGRLANRRRVTAAVAARTPPTADAVAVGGRLAR